VTLVASSAANDQLSQFDLSLTSLTLNGSSEASGSGTGGAGGTGVPLIGAPVHLEFMHLNGSAEPIGTVSVPQGTYSSATATVGSSGFTCLDFSPADGSIDVSYFGYESTPDSSVTVTLPGPIHVAGAHMGLQLDLLVSKSASWATCDPNGLSSYAITPAFSLAPLQLSSAPTNAQTGLETGLQGTVAAVSGSSFTVTAMDGASCDAPAGQQCAQGTVDGPSWQVSAGAGTVFQGISDASQLAVGLPVEMDAAIQPDGSLLASRIAVYDANPADLTVYYDGPLLQVISSDPTLFDFGTEKTGPLLAGQGSYFNYSQASFQTSGELTNLSSLPFAASFTAANMVPGQNLEVTTHALQVTAGPGGVYAPAATVTLRPQTIDGTIEGVSSQGDFTVYTVALAPYDAFPTFAVRPGQTTLLTDPASVVVYVDGGTQMLNSGSIAVGGVQRFTGLVFNDGGTLRMDCSQVADGVPE
jgi:hypothetical protein